MNGHRFNSPDEFIAAVRESKAEYEKKRRVFTWEEKINVLVKLQEKAHFAGKISVRPWPLGRTTPVAANRTPTTGQ